MEIPSSYLRTPGVAFRVCTAGEIFTATTWITGRTLIFTPSVAVTFTALR